jgi:hypothetical protein
MLRRAQSSISLATIDPVAEPYRDEWDDDPVAITITGSSGNGDDQDGPPSSLCTRCQNFDIQSFGQVAGRRKGYLLHDVEEAAAAERGCEFCALLLDAIKDVPKPEYFYQNMLFPGRVVMHPDLYVHMTVSENYKDDTQKAAYTASSSGLGVNRIYVEVGDRFSGVRNPSAHEICLAADPSKSILCMITTARC